MHNQHKILRVLQLITLLKSRPAKPISYIGEMLDSSDRTVYRYLDLLEELGFVVHRDSGNRVFIEATSNDRPELIFSGEEARFVRDLVMTAGKKNKLSDSVLQKLYVNSDLQVGSDLLLRAHLGRLVQVLREAVNQRRQVVLKSYHSANSNEISDRLVEPIRFTDNYQNLVAYEIASGKNKYFNIERISSVAVTKKPFKHARKHQYSPPDVFGFSDNGERHPIDFSMSLRASVILKEEYPQTALLIRKEKKNYRFKTTVFDLKPVTRFVIGFFGEITINGSPAFKKHVREQIRKMVGA